MKKWLILGNSGAGKTTLAARISARLGIPHCALDRLFWEEGGCVHKRPRELVLADLDRVRAADAWVVEGTFGDLIERCVPDADALVFLDLPWEECERNLRGRGPEPEKWQRPELAEEMFAGLLDWARDYAHREDRFSLARHERIYLAFAKAKWRLHTRAEVEAWVKDSPLGEKKKW